MGTKRIMLRVIAGLLLIAELAACATQAPGIRPDQTSASAGQTPSASAQSPPGTLPQGYSWWNEDVFYEIFVHSFYDSNGDGIGDFKGLTEKLDYLNDGDPATNSDLGIRGIWLMPIFPSPSYHGYDVTNYLGINPDLGTMDDFNEFLSQAHQRGIKVVIDLPLNHTSSFHSWFQQSTTPNAPFRDYYLWSETDPGYPGPWGEDVWHEGSNGGYYYGIFGPGMPDLNYTNPQVVEEMDKVVKFWLGAGVDGFRLDGARYIVEDGQKQADTPATHEYYRHLRETVKAFNPEAMLVGEVWTDNFTVSTYTRADQIDLAFNFDMASGIIASANTGRNDKVMNALNFTQKLFPNGQTAPFITNHDMDRVMSQLGGDIEKGKNAAAMLFASPGVPFIYYGEEIGILGKRGTENTDVKRRLPMQWSPDKNASFTAGTPWTTMWPFYSHTNVEVQNTDPNSLLSFYKDWIELRYQNPALLFGQTSLIKSTDPAVFAILRSYGGQAIICLLNLTGQPIADYTLSMDGGPLNGNYVVEPLYGTGSFAGIQSTSQGGIGGYTPLPTLPPFGRYLLKLIPAP